MRTSYAATASKKQLQPIRAEIDGLYRCTAAGVSVHADAPVLSLCRALIANGHDRRAPLHAYRDGVLALRIKSIGYGARWTVQDGHDGRPTLTLFRPKAGTGLASHVARTARWAA